jgi:hypothetical protein
MASLMPDGGSTGDLRVIDSAASCPSGFTPLNWTAGTGWCRRCIGPRNAARYGNSRCEFDQVRGRGLLRGQEGSGGSNLATRAPT